MNDFIPQVPASHYRKSTYLSRERWLSYWHQIDAIKASKPTSVLEIGVGNGMVRDVLAGLGYQVVTVDIDPELKPTHVASVTSLPFGNDSFDSVLCAEVLEHLPWEESLKAINEIFRVTKKLAVITVPHSGYVVSLISKLPFLPWVHLGFKIPHFWKKHSFNGQHYWECGKKGWPKNIIRQALQSVGFNVKLMKIYPDDPSHVVYECTKRT